MPRQERGDGRGGDEPCSQGSCTVLEKNGKLFGLTNLLEAQERPSGDGTGEQEVGLPRGGGQIQRGAATAPGVPGDAPGRAQPPVGARCEVAVRRARFLRGSDVPPPGRFLASPRPGPFSFPRLIFHVPRVSFSRCFFPTKRVLRLRPEAPRAPHRVVCAPIAGAARALMPLTRLPCRLRGERDGARLLIPHASLGTGNE